MNKIIEKTKYKILSKMNEYNKKIRKINRKFLGLLFGKYIPFTKAAKILGDKTRCYFFMRNQTMWKNLSVTADLDYEFTQEGYYKSLLNTSVYVYVKPEFSLKNELVNNGRYITSKDSYEKAYVKREDLYELIDTLSIQK